MYGASIETTQLASGLAAEGGIALRRGDTALAKQKYGEAGNLLEREAKAARKTADRELLKFLAASQYYHGGNYDKAQRVCGQIQANSLSPEARHIYERFISDVKHRASERYKENVRLRLTRLLQQKQFAGIIDLLKSHPFALDPSSLSWIRAVALEELHQFESAMYFFRRLYEKTGNEPLFLILPAYKPLDLLMSGNVPEALEYAHLQLQQIPNAITYITASLVHQRLFDNERDPEQRLTLFRQQIDYAERAIAALNELPARIRQFPAIDQYLGLCLTARAVSHDAMNQRVEALRAIDSAIAITPGDRGLLALRDVISGSPGDSEKADGIVQIRSAEQKQKDILAKMRSPLADTTNSLNL